MPCVAGGLLTPLQALLQVCNAEMPQHLSTQPVVSPRCFQSWLLCWNGLPGLGPSVGIKMRSFWENAYGSQRLNRWRAAKNWAPEHPNKVTTNFCEVRCHPLMQTSHLACPQLQMQSFETKFGQLSVTSLGAQLEGIRMLHW